MLITFHFGWIYHQSIVILHFSIPNLTSQICIQYPKIKYQSIPLRKITTLTKLYFFYIAIYNRTNNEMTSMQIIVLVLIKVGAPTPKLALYTTALRTTLLLQFASIGHSLTRICTFTCSQILNCFYFSFAMNRHPCQ